MTIGPLVMLNFVDDEVNVRPVERMSPEEIAAWNAVAAIDQQIYNGQNPTFWEALQPGFARVSGALNTGATIGNFVGENSLMLMNPVASFAPQRITTTLAAKYGRSLGGNVAANRQVTSVAREFGIPRNDFSDYVHQAKRLEGRGGADNFTYDELRDLAREFLQRRSGG